MRLGKGKMKPVSHNPGGPAETRATSRDLLGYREVALESKDLSDPKSDPTT